MHHPAGAVQRLRTGCMLRHVLLQGSLELARQAVQAATVRVRAAEQEERATLDHRREAEQQQQQSLLLQQQRRNEAARLVRHLLELEILFFREKQTLNPLNFH